MDMSSGRRPMKRTKKKEQQPVDRIGQLPNEILVHILSFLPLKDSARTSVLSKVWMDLWMFVARLDFDSSIDFEEVLVVRNDFSCEAEAKRFFRMKSRKRNKYVKWVRKVVESHKSMALDEFRICFDLDRSDANHIDHWLQYAFARRVQRLEFNLGDRYHCHSRVYAFPAGLLGLRTRNPRAVYVSPGYFEDGFKSLRSLTFNNVLLSRKVVEFFLHNCPSLERLVVRRPGPLKELEVCGQSVALKHLEITGCPQLYSLTICDTNIVSLKTTTNGRALVLKNVPMLVDVFVGGCGYWSRSLIRSAISALSCCLWNLEALTLLASDDDVRAEKIAAGTALPQLTKLKQFTLAVVAEKDRSLMEFTSLIRASPNLEKFILTLHWQHNIGRKPRESKKAAVSFPLQHLKVVELRGYYGRTTEVELVEYLIQNGVALERIIVDPHHHPLATIVEPEQDSFSPVLRHKRAKEKIARNLAKQQLQELVPSCVELVLL